MSRLSQQQGVGLIEVLVAVLLLSVAVLGFSALQLQAIKATEESLVRTQALSVVRGIAENMRANPSELKTYEDTINAGGPNTTIVDSCQELDDSCTSAQIAVKESKNAVAQLNQYDISMKVTTCPGTKSVSDFSEVKCVIAAWGDTEAELNVDNVNACADTFGIYKSGSNCIIVETY